MTDSKSALSPSVLCSIKNLRKSLLFICDFALALAQIEREKRGAKRWLESWKMEEMASEEARERQNMPIWKQFNMVTPS